VFISIAKICWGFNVKKYVNPQGAVEEPDTFGYTDGGFNIRPCAFRKCGPRGKGANVSALEVRSPERLKVIERELRNAEQFLNVYEPYT
jgi:hypothetical protein